MQTIYRPGQWYLIVIPGALVALPPDVPGDVLARLWERLPQDKTLATVVDVLTAHSGGAFASLPPFVAAVAEGADVRIALRGGVSARVSTATESHSFSGAEVTTWSERFVGSASRIEITVENVEGAAALPVQSGVVRVAAVSAELETDDERPLSSALGPVPVIEVGAAGASAAVLSGTAAPSIADFGGSLPAASESIAVTEGEPELEESTPVVDASVAADAPVAEDVPADDTPEEVPAEAEEPEVAPVDEPVDPLDELFGDAAGTSEPATSEPGPEPAPAVDGATIVPTEVTLAPSAEDFDQLWGATVHSVPAAGAAPAAPAVPAPGLGDHDGATISAAELRALRQQPAGDDVPTAVIPVTPASTGRIRVSTGQVVALDRTVIIGRRPRSTRASGANLPHLVAVESPQQDISRSHLEIRPEGDTVVVIDLHTTNGSTLLRPGADPIRLHPGEQTLVLSGDVVDLGDGVKVAFEDLP